MHMLRKAPLEGGVDQQAKRLPALLTAEELMAFYEAVWHTRHATHMVMLKLLLFTGIRNAELAHLKCLDVDLTGSGVRIDQGKGRNDRWVLFPQSFRGELAQYLGRQQERGAMYLFESNRLRPFST